MNFKSVIKLLCFIQLFIALLMCIPFALSIVYKEQVATEAFLFTISIMVVFHFILLLFLRKEPIKIKAKDSYLFVNLTWVIATAFGALPLYLTKTLPTYSASYFEIMSGFTTTGATALQTIEDQLKSILFWRGMTNWLGGMGIVVLFVAILPFMGVRGANLVSAESVGPTKDKLTPHIQHTAMILWGIYVGFSVLEVLFLLLGKLSIFDAVTVTFGTMGAAGFSAKNSSIGGYNSAYVDWVVIVFMTIAGMNFALFFKAIQGRIDKVIKDAEFRVYISLIFVFSLVGSVSLLINRVYPNFITAIRYSAFHVISILTTTGFAICDYTSWPVFNQMLLFLLFFVGGCAGSAGGGMKVVRISTLMTLAKNTIKKRLHPRAVVQTRLGGDIIAQDTTLSIAGFIGVYLLTGFVGALIISTSGRSLETCLSAAFLFVGNIGIGLGDVGPAGNFSIFSPILQWVASFLMLVGRLELFTVYALFSKSFWKRG